MSPSSHDPVSSRVLDAAIAWQLCLDCGQASEAEREEFAKWYAAHEEHARAWLQLGLVDQKLSRASRPGRNALLRSRDQAHARMRRLGRGLAGLVLACGLGLALVKQYAPIDYWLADQRTGTGEQRSLRLADNTVVRLNTHSAIDVKFDARERRVVLRDGEILVETASHDDPRPFIVETRDGRMRALGTRFLVRREDDGTLLTVLQSAVAAHPEQANEERIFQAGQQVLIQAGSLSHAQPVPMGADAWTQGMLVVDNARLADVLTELARYRPGYLAAAPDVANLRITGSFPLNDTDLALRALTPTLPVDIVQRTSWWVTVVARNASAEKAGKNAP